MTSIFASKAALAVLGCAFALALLYKAFRLLGRKKTPAGRGVWVDVTLHSVLVMLAATMILAASLLLNAEITKRMEPQVEKDSLRETRPAP